MNLGLNMDGCETFIASVTFENYCTDMQPENIATA